MLLIDRVTAVACKLFFCNSSQIFTCGLRAEHWIDNHTVWHACAVLLVATDALLQLLLCMNVLFVIDCLCVWLVTVCVSSWWLSVWLVSGDCLCVWLVTVHVSGWWPSVCLAGDCLCVWLVTVCVSGRWLSVCLAGDRLCVWLVTVCVSDIGAPKFGLDRTSAEYSAEGFGSVRFGHASTFGRTSVLFSLGFALRSAHFIACVQSPYSKN